MASLTEMVAVLVVQSSAAAFSHFGVTLDTPAPAPAHHAVEARVVARTPLRREPLVKASACPETQRAQVMRT